jgi:phosphohistidine phosphatase
MSSTTGGAPAPELYLLRHADAGDPDQWTGDDADRPLSNKGRRQAHRVADHLARIGWRPDAILTSPKVRARETADAVAEALGLIATIDERLGSGFGQPELAEIVGADAGRTRILLVGHDPDFSDLASLLVGAAIRLRKGSLIRIDLDAGARSGVVRWLLPPDALAGR